jgi:hypothetical protein
MTSFREGEVMQATWPDLDLGLLEARGTRVGRGEVFPLPRAIRSVGTAKQHYPLCQRKCFEFRNRTPAHLLPPRRRRLPRGQDIARTHAA